MPREHPLTGYFLADPNTPLSTEKTLLLCCARTELSQLAVREVQKVNNTGINWSHLPALARRHRVTGLLYQNLQHYFATDVPPAAMAQLRSEHLAITRRSLYFAGELLRILRSFQDYDISAIPYKGPALGAAVYGNITLREFSDLDILIKPKDIIKAAEILQAANYIPTKSLPENTGEILNNPSEKDFTFSSPDKRVYVELHYKLARDYQGFSMPMEQLWQHSASTTLLDTQIPCLSPENTLLILCFNGSKDRWNRLSLVCDVSELLRAFPGLDWEYIFREAHRSQSLRRLYLGLFLAKEMLSAPLPTQIYRQISSDKIVQKLFKTVFQWFAEDMQRQRWGLEKNLFTIRMFEALTHKRVGVRRFAREIITTSEEDQNFQNLPGCLANATGLARFLRLAKKYSRSFFYSR